MRRLIALHGFLGSPADFLPLAMRNLYAPAIFRMTPGPMATWVPRFTNQCPDDAVLMGYSMGGRIALNALVHAPKKFHAAIIIAAHPGLVNAHERMTRYHHDRQWAQKFLRDPWDALMLEWNQLPALRNSSPRFLPECEFSRRVLAQTLRYLSLAHQTQLIPRINALDLPILWLAPSQEAHILDGLKLKSRYSRVSLISGGGHRFLFEYPHQVSAHINHFLASIAAIDR